MVPEFETCKYNHYFELAQTIQPNLPAANDDQMENKKEMTGFTPVTSHHIVNSNCRDYSAEG